MPSGTSKKQRVSPPVQAPYRPPSLIDLGTSHSIESTLVKVLIPREQVPGYIYAYYSSSHAAMVKIGMTKQKRNASTLELTNKLHVVNAILFDSAELVACRRTLPYKACCCNHREWFQTSFEHAVAVIEKNTAYANTKPYVNPGNNIWQISVPHWKTRHDVYEPIVSSKNSMPTENSTVEGLEDSFHVDEAFSKGSVHAEEIVIREPDSNNHKYGVDRVPAPDAPTEGDIKEEEEREGSFYTAKTTASNTDSNEQNLVSAHKAS
ncbi:hypothetical protein N7G274_000118 [Stereocaulon virgatum]|uniref:GIY-YIG homing endonuclease n=1 Tax=Stereocaulon virgatum TaxID=373712 RepID=A0ABR4AR72_9LECA